MLLAILDYLTSLHRGFNVLNYLSLRMILSALTALIITLSLGSYTIALLQKLQLKQAIRSCGPQTHSVKKGTPTMGGILVIFALIISSLLWGDLSNLYVWLVLLVTFGFALIGFVDDWLKVSKQNSQGLRSRWKYFWQSVCAILAALLLYLTAQFSFELTLFVPFFKNVSWYLGVFFILFAYLVIVGTSNAVNLTDGLDGLAIMPAVMVACALAIFCYVGGRFDFASYLYLPYLPGIGELAVICTALSGAGLGFLWFNTHPAQMFMGDVGSLALGAALGTIAVIAKQELVLFIMGGIFVAETLSVILQVASFKLTGRRIFAMSPLHHHFELKGWNESKIVVRFWIITLILVLIGLSSLKVR